ncbi:DUF1883 domain-containing protein [Providencia rettgeri]|uniref:DUF1883 domain-containing protein n=2 Tax=Providencia rettgeri TaxID=587 RepID=UPI0032B50CF6
MFSPKKSTEGTADIPQHKEITMAVHSRYYINGNDVVSVQCSHQINVLVMDDNQLNNYRNGREFKYHGGFYKKFPANIRVPHSGYWNVVLALPAGHRVNIRYSINIIS